MYAQGIKQTYESISHKIKMYGLLTAEARGQMIKREIPDLLEVCDKLQYSFENHSAPYNALQFSSILSSVKDLSAFELGNFLNNPQSNHVLIDNDLLKVVLIRWEPGKVSSIHGHPAGGGVYKVLFGSIEEMRYTTGESPQLLSVSQYHKGSMSYIDDTLGFHAVGNPFKTPAISLHAYTYGGLNVNNQ